MVLLHLLLKKQKRKQENYKEHQNITEIPLKKMTNAGKYFSYGTWFIFSLTGRCTTIYIYMHICTKYGLAIHLINKS